VAWTGSPPERSSGGGGGGGGYIALQRSSSMPVGSADAASSSSSSSLFYRNARDITKSSRSIRHDLEHLMEDEEDSDDENDFVSRPGSAPSFEHEELSAKPRAQQQQQQQQPPPHEAQPLLEGPALSTPGWESKDEDQRLVRIAAAFLNDYEAGQAPTLPPDLINITDLHLHLHSIRFSKLWRIAIVLATACLFVGSCFEGSDEDENWKSYDETYLAERMRRKERIVSFCTVIPVVACLLDICMMAVLFSRRGHTGRLDSLLGADSQHDENGNSTGRNRQASSIPAKPKAKRNKARTSRSFWWAMPVVFFLAVLSVETFVVIRSRTILKRRIWSSLAKPIVLFYVSSRTRNALDALNRVIRIVLRVILIELFLIFTFGCVAVQLFGDDFDSFEGLPTSFLSMFQLSTTVVNPSLWMPVVAEYGRSSSIFFVIFLITSVFYLHSLVLSVVFQSYMDGMAAIREHSALDREENLQLAYEALSECKKDEERRAMVAPTHLIRGALGLLREHYNVTKMDVLMQTVDPFNSGSIDYNAFRMKVPKALNFSVHSVRPRNNISRLLELFAAGAAITNLLYVVMASSSYSSWWWDAAVVPVGFAITLLCLVELVARLVVFKILRAADVVSGTPNSTFDGVAFVAAVTSMVGLALHGTTEYKRAMDCVFTGRAIDMIRCLRLNEEARGIVKRSSEVIPALLGPILLIVSAVHIFTYLGIAIWGGKVVCGANLDLTPFYDLNNFNTYLSGVITLFQVLVVNDWHAIALVFILPGHAATNALVYPFFIIANLALTSVLLNVMIAFFVNAFVTKATAKLLIGAEQVGTRRKASGLEHSILSTDLSAGINSEADVATVDQSITTITISERQGFDNILRTIARDSGEEGEENSARIGSQMLQAFEELSFTSDGSSAKVGYLVSCHKSKHRYGKQRLMNHIKPFMEARTLHQIIGEMSMELANLAEGEAATNYTLERIFHVPESAQALELRASLLAGSTVSLFVSRLVDASLEISDDQGQLANSTAPQTLSAYS